MMASHTSKLKITLWVSVVYVLSFICYLPALLEQNGINIPEVFLYSRYLYVCIPAIATMFLLICERNIKIYFAQMFSGKLTVKYILIWAVCMVTGILGSCCYSARNF